MSGALNSRTARLLAFAVSVLILISPAVLNGFPFVLDDTMDYVALYPVLYRSTFYSLFVNATDLQISPWLPILAQAAIVTHLIGLWLRILVRDVSPLVLPAVTLALTLTTSVGFVTSYLMPDVFSGALILAVAALLFARDKLSKWEGWYLMALVGLSVSVHLSHVPILALTLCVVAVALLATGSSLVSILRRMLPVALPALAAAGMLFVSHFVLFGIAKLSPAGPIFFLASLIGNGPATDYLKSVCPDAGYRICADVAHLPMDSNSFLWGGLLYKLGWFEGYRDEAQTIVTETLKSRPLDVAKMAVVSFGRALRAHAPAEDFRPLGWNMWRVEASLSKYGEATVERFRDSAQVRETIPKPLIKRIDAIVLPLSLIVFAGLLFKLGPHDRAVAWCALPIATGVFVNVLVCAVFSGIFDRYQTRVSWLVPLFAVLLVLRFYRQRSTASDPLPSIQVA